MSEKAVLSLDKNNIPGPLEGGQTFPPASHQEVGVGSAQRENRGEGEQPEPSKQTMIYCFGPVQYQPLNRPRLVYIALNYVYKL